MRKNLKAADGYTTRRVERDFYRVICESEHGQIPGPEFQTAAIHFYVNRRTGGAMVYRNFLLIVVLLILLASGVTRAQDAVSSAGPSLTLDQAVDLALRHNRAVKVAELGVERADEDIAAAKTFRLPALHAYTLVSRNLANNELKVRNPTADIFRS